MNNSPTQKKIAHSKCSYCHKTTTEKFSIEINGLKELYFCSEECKQESIAYVANVNKNGMLFLGLVFGTVFLMVITNGIVSALNYNERYGLWVTSIAMTVLGATMIKFPFCTPQTVQWLGIKKAKFAGRCLGFALIIGMLVKFPKTIAI